MLKFKDSMASYWDHEDKHIHGTIRISFNTQLGPMTFNSLVHRPVRTYNITEAGQKRFLCTSFIHWRKAFDCSYYNHWSTLVAEKYGIRYTRETGFSTKAKNSISRFVKRFLKEKYNISFAGTKAIIPGERARRRPSIINGNPYEQYAWDQQEKVDRKFIKSTRSSVNMDTLKIRKSTVVEKDITEYLSYVTFTKDKSGKYFGFVKLDFDTDFGPITFNTIIFKDPSGNPKIMWYNTLDGWTTKSRRSGGYRRAEETGFAEDTKNNIHAIIMRCLKEKHGINTIEVVAPPKPVIKAPVKVKKPSKDDLPF